MILVIYLFACMFAVFLIKVVFYIIAHIITAISKNIASILKVKEEDVEASMYIIAMIIFIILIILLEYH